MTGKAFPRSDKGRRRSLVDSVRDAGAGLAFVLRTQRNMRIHVGATGAVLALAWYFRVDRVGWALLLVAVGGVLAAELLNTAVEAVVDLYTEDFHPLAKVAKDVAAGAVLVQALIALGLGWLVFAPFVPSSLAWAPLGVWAAVTVAGLRGPKEVGTDGKSAQK